MLPDKQGIHPQSLTQNTLIGVVSFQTSTGHDKVISRILHDKNQAQPSSDRSMVVKFTHGTEKTSQNLRTTNNNNNNNNNNNSKI